MKKTELRLSKGLKEFDNGKRAEQITSEHIVSKAGYG